MIQKYELMLCALYITLRISKPLLQELVDTFSKIHVKIMRFQFYRVLLLRMFTESVYVVISE